MTLDEIGLKHRTDKSSSHHNLLVVYERLFRGKTINVVMEIGIHKGASLRTWAEFFPQATVFGLDLDPKTLINEGNIHSFQCNQADAKQIRAIMEAHHIQPDVVVEDGSHVWSHQITSYETIFPLLKPGAIYIAEDLITSVPAFAAIYRDRPPNPLEYFAAIKECQIVWNDKHTNVVGIVTKQ